MIDSWGGQNDASPTLRAQKSAQCGSVTRLNLPVKQRRSSFANIIRLCSSKEVQRTQHTCHAYTCGSARALHHIPAHTEPRERRGMKQRKAAEKLLLWLRGTHAICTPRVRICSWRSVSGANSQKGTCNRIGTCAAHTTCTRRLALFWNSPKWQCVRGIGCGIVCRS
jgi:hypothetical protein